jgi:hypothetical protein
MVPILVLPAVMTVYGYNKMLVYQTTALCWVSRPTFLSAGDFGWNSWLTPAQNESRAMSELLVSESFVVNVAANTKLAKQHNLNTRAGREYVYNRIKPEVTVAATTKGDHTLSIVVTDKDPLLAQQIASALLTAYANNFQQNRQTLDSQAIIFYQQQLVSAQSQQAQDSANLQDYLHAHPGTAVYGAQIDPTLAQLQQQVSQDQSGVSSINSELTSLQKDLAALPVGTTSFLQVEDAPQLPLQPALQKSKLLLTYTGEYGLGSAAALVGVIVIGLTLLDRKVYSIEDLRRIDEEMELELPSIEALPTLAVRGHGPSDNGAQKDGMRDSILAPALWALPPISAEFERTGAQRASRTASSAPRGAGDGELGA